MITCKICGRQHPLSTRNCCWIYCDCGSKICGQCGGTSLSTMDMDADDDEAKYWCCLECTECGLKGCAMCI
jgi:hypothetical protein